MAWSGPSGSPSGGRDRARRWPRTAASGRRRGRACRRPATARPSRATAEMIGNSSSSSAGRGRGTAGRSRRAPRRARASWRSTLLSTTTVGRSGGERLRQHVAGLGQRPLGRVDQQQDAVDHGQGPLDLAAEVGVARRVDQVDPRVPHWTEAALARIVMPRSRSWSLESMTRSTSVLVGAEDAGGAQHGVDQGGLAVVDVGDEREVAKGCAHCGRLRFATR